MATRKTVGKTHLGYALQTHVCMQAERRSGSCGWQGACWEMLSEMGVHVCVCVCGSKEINNHYACMQ